MICPQCHQEIQEIVDGAECPHCHRRNPSFCSYGAPTLIRGVSEPARVPSRRLSDSRAPLLWPMVWLGLALITIFLFWATTLEPEHAVSRPWLPASPPALRQVVQPAVQVDPLAQSDDMGTSRLVIRIPAGRWIDTGIDMCGCVHFTVSASGEWKTPAGIITGARGAAGHSRDRLAKQQPYGSLLAKVGTDPFMLVGTSRVMDGEDFNSDGTLKLGMNARDDKPGSRSEGSISVTITGSFDTGRP